MPACALDDAFAPEWCPFFALRLGVRLKRFKQLYVPCEGEVIVQGDEGPVRGVAQVVDCHGVTVSHEEREEEEVEQEV